MTQTLKTVVAPVVLAAALLAGCSALQKPERPTLYDFGPPSTTPAAATREAPLPPLALADVEASGAFDSSALLYRLGYADERQLQPYAHARWTMPPAQLVRQRLRERLGQRRAVLTPGEAAVALRASGEEPLVLRLELEEFSQVFDAPARSAGLVRLRATLVALGIGGERLLAQRAFAVQRPAATGDAPGGVRALASATDAAADEIAAWLQQVR